MNHLTPECLETDRLLLRTFRENDWKDLHKYYSDEECTKYTIGRTLTEGESWRTMAAMNKQFKLDGDFDFWDSRTVRRQQGPDDHNQLQPTSKRMRLKFSLRLCSFVAIQAQRPGAHERPRLQTERDGRVRCSSWFGVSFIALVTRYVLCD
jgi:hypothetical protein